MISSGMIAEDRAGAGIPHRDQLIFVGADEAIAERHRDAMKAAFGDAPQETTEIDFVECDRRQIGHDRDMEQRCVDDEGPSCLHEDSDQLEGRPG